MESVARRAAAGGGDWWKSKASPIRVSLLPRVHAVRITRLGTGELPPPVHPYWDQLINGSLDTEFVEMEGVVTTVRADGVTLLTHGGKIKVLVFGTNGGTNNVALKPYEDALIRLRGCLFASWDADNA